MSRTLRSKRLRAALYIAADGKCKACGTELGPSWHADHVVPWSKTKTTNVHEMQALCPACNQAKGATDMRRDRSHQTEMRNIAKQIVAGTWDGSRTIITDTTPGGGKTGQSILLAAPLLGAGIVHQVLHFVPRKALLSQVCTAWSAPEWNPDRFKLYASRNEAPLHPRGYVGVCASYDQLAANPDLYLAYAKRAPTLGIFDELQFLADTKVSAWARESRRVAELLNWLLGMSGTLYRHDSRPIPFVEYTVGADGLRYAQSHIRYTLRKAVAECAVKGADFTFLDGDARWLDSSGERCTTLSETEDEEQGKALYTFLSRPQVWHHLADKWIEHWKGWRREVYPSRAIAIALDQEQARMLVTYIKERHGIDTALAISDEPSAHEALERFRGDPGAGRRGTPEVLVTVAMASVGFDVQDCTHLLYLSHYRSLPNALQAFARTTRIDPHCNVAPRFQRAFIFTSDDPKMRAIVEWLREENQAGLRELADRESREAVGEAPKPRTFVPLDASPGSVSFANMDERIDDPEASQVDSVLASVPEAASIPPTVLAKVLRAASAQSAWTPQPPPASGPPTRKETEEDVERLGRILDARTSSPFGTTNKILVRKFGQKRTRSDAELEQSLYWIKQRLTALDSEDAS